MTRKVMRVGSVQLTRPTMGELLSGTRVRRPPPKFEPPENCRVWPFWTTCQLNAPPGWIDSATEVSGLGCAVQAPVIVAPSGTAEFTAETGSGAPGGGSAPRARAR